MGYTSSTAKAFIERIAPLMKAEAEKRGYKIVSTAIAQAVIEGAAGTSVLARDYHNHFGLKCGKNWKGASVNMKTKEEYKVGTLTTIKDNFRAYSNDEEGVRGYYDFINTSRYANLKQAKTPLEYAQFLKQDGYATSSTYVNTLISTVNKYGLDKYDNGKIVIVDESYTYQERPTIKMGSRGTYVVILQEWLNATNIKKYDCGKIDGIFGKKTDAAVRALQKDNKLVVDGIVGPKTWASLPVVN